MAGRSLSFLVVGTALLIGFSAGCATAVRRHGNAYDHDQHYVAQKHLLFDPYGAPPMAAVVRRSDWPSTIVYQTTGEQIEYQEAIIDQQGRNSHNNDHDYYRRFYSTRSGRASR